VPAAGLEVRREPHAEAEVVGLVPWGVFPDDALDAAGHAGIFWCCCLSI